MGITSALRALIEEKRKAAEDAEMHKRVREHIERKNETRMLKLMEEIDGAAGRLDAGHDDPTKWRPSAQIKLAYFALSTAETPNAEANAVRFVRGRLEA